MANNHPDNHVLEADDGDADSIYGGSVSDASYTSSLTSSVLNYKYENGRRYHAFHEGEYFLPNDEAEQDRLDLSHHIYRLVFGGNLYLAPIKSPRRVLDLGTGTGIWAIEFADEHPEAEVIGNDLSPIQPSWTPPNCRFEVDDFEQDWEYSRPFDYIHGRELEGSIRDDVRFLQQAYENLAPGGYLEMESIEVLTTSDDGTHKKAKVFAHLHEALYDAAEKFGKSVLLTPTWKEKMTKIGFEDVNDVSYKLPHSPWPKDPKLKEIGRYQQLNVFNALGSYPAALLTRVLGWTREEVEVSAAAARNEVKDLSNHIRSNIRVVYGRKPQK